MSAEIEGLPDWDPTEFHGKFQVNLWDPDHLDAPIRSLVWLPEPIPRMARARRPAPAPFRPGSSTSSVWPLVAISPDGKTVAVAALAARYRGSAVLGERTACPRREGRTTRDVRRLSMNPDRETFGSWPLGQTTSLATAGTTAGGA